MITDMETPRMNSPPSSGTSSSCIASLQSAFERDVNPGRHRCRIQIVVPVQQQAPRPVRVAFVQFRRARAGERGVRAGIDSVSICRSIMSAMEWRRPESRTSDTLAHRYGSDHSNPMASKCG